MHFSVGTTIRNVYRKSRVAASIISSFCRTRVWGPAVRGKNSETTEIYFESLAREDRVTLMLLVDKLSKQQRRLLRDFDVEKNGNVKMDTTDGAHLTAEIFLEPLKNGMKRR